MLDHVQPGVEKLIGSPSDRDDVSLIVGVSDASSDEVIARIEDAGATVEEVLFYDNLAVSIDDTTDLKQLCTIDAVTSVEIEGTWEQMDEGNSYPRDTHPN